eukprot:647351-Prymnesium_polylepis.2
MSQFGGNCVCGTISCPSSSTRVGLRANAQQQKIECALGRTVAASSQFERGGPTDSRVRYRHVGAAVVACVADRCWCGGGGVSGGHEVADSSSRAGGWTAGALQGATRVGVISRVHVSQHGAPAARSLCETGWTFALSGALATRLS